MLYCTFPLMHAACIHVNVGRNRVKEEVASVTMGKLPMNKDNGER